MTQDRRLIPLSALQHYAFCPRQCALIHNEQAWADNYLTAQGNLLHKRVDSGDPETRNGTKFERAVMVSAEKLGITGKLDLIEKDLKTGALTPVEYKKGKSKPGNWDKIQLCAQGLCLEEMTGQAVAEGYLWYWQTRKREFVAFDKRIRQQTLAVIQQVQTIFLSGELPKPKYEKKCKACSLFDICNPKLIEHDNSATYIKQLFSQD
ncbi:CRISPR-associated protein Cas4 [Psychromonas antarctica]|uniref:CRISPR-associated protein Cas4 n=1 Tax=Psychromonas antarctica TaxID=67573 RepID=UPI001EE95548|nr:CRISPR-associated protein Cas4 [Psychromonas antarctica]MCG6201145.1 CRISPR-associated protein Cas4 [Psychromonas antarctica]